MKKVIANNDDLWRALVATKLGLDESASLPEISAAIGKLQTQLESAKKMIAQLRGERATKNEKGSEPKP